MGRGLIYNLKLHFNPSDEEIARSYGCLEHISRQQAIEVLGQTESEDE